MAWVQKEGQALAAGAGNADKLGGYIEQLESVSMHLLHLKSLGESPTPDSPVFDASIISAALHPVHQVIQHLKTIQEEERNK